jgi:secreted PhoX family phosphatase
MSDHASLPVDAIGRRTMLRHLTLAAAGLGLATMTPGTLLARRRGPDYGPLAEAIDETTGLPILKLPAGFRYRSFGWQRDALTDGSPTPGRHDGMAVVRARGRRVWITRNHEMIGRGTSFGPPEVTYDPSGPGGTTTLVFDTKSGEVVESWASLSGTTMNCAGGPTPWGTWLSCEESTADLDQPHGWVFEVPGEPAAQPLRAMGRFRHEACAVDPKTSVVYMTEDMGTAGFYRFVPNAPKRLAQGGALQMLAVSGEPGKELIQGVPVGVPLPVEWVDIAEPERAHAPGTRDGLGVFAQGRESGGAVFRRLEGAWFGTRRVVFVSTSGGAAGLGQVWEYHPKREELTLRWESGSAEEAQSPDNVVLSNRNGMVLCEDNGSEGQRLLGLGPDGAFPLAENALVLNGERNGLSGDFRKGEWAGACVHGRWLFANLQTPGITFAITGPWKRGPL